MINLVTSPFQYSSKRRTDHCFLDVMNKTVLDSDSHFYDVIVPGSPGYVDPPLIGSRERFQPLLPPLQPWLPRRFQGTRSGARHPWYLRVMVLWVRVLRWWSTGWKIPSHGRVTSRFTWVIIIVFNMRGMWHIEGLTSSPCRKHNLSGSILILIVSDVIILWVLRWRHRHVTSGYDVRSLCWIVAVAMVILIWTGWGLLGVVVPIVTTTSTTRGPLRRRVTLTVGISTASLQYFIHKILREHVLGRRLGLVLHERFVQTVQDGPAELITEDHVENELDAGVDDGEHDDEEFPPGVERCAGETHRAVDADRQRLVRLDVAQHHGLEDMVGNQAKDGYKPCKGRRKWISRYTFHWTSVSTYSLDTVSGKDSLNCDAIISQTLLTFPT